MRKLQRLHHSGVVPVTFNAVVAGRFPDDHERAGEVPWSQSAAACAEESPELLRIKLCRQASSGVSSEAVVELIGERYPIFDYSPQAMRYRLYLAGSGGEALFEEDHVRQQLADALQTNPNSLAVSPVRDIPFKHANVMCAEFDWSSESYERLLELSTQGFVRIAHPTKPNLNGTKVAVAQSVDDLQQLLGFGILRAIGSTAADGGAEVGAAPLRIAPQHLRLTAAFISGVAGSQPQPGAGPATPPPSQPPAAPQGAASPTMPPPPAQAGSPLRPPAEFQRMPGASRLPGAMPGAPPTSYPTDIEMVAYRLRRQGRAAEVTAMNDSFRNFQIHQQAFAAYLETLPPGALADAHLSGDGAVNMGEGGSAASLSVPANPLSPPPVAAQGGGPAAWNVQAFLDEAAHEAARGSRAAGHAFGASASSSVDVTGATPRTHLQPFPPGLFHRLPPFSSAHPLPPASIPRSQPSDEHGSLGRVSVLEDATRCGTSGPSRDVRAPLPAECATRLDTSSVRERRGDRGELEREVTRAVLEAAVGCVLSGVGSVYVRAGDVSDARDGAGGIGSAGRGGLGEVEPTGMARHGGIGETAPIGRLHVAGDTATSGLHRGEPLGAGLGAGRQDIGMAPPGLDGIDVPLALLRAAPQAVGLGAGPRGNGAAPPGGGGRAELGAGRRGHGAALLGGGAGARRRLHVRGRGWCRLGASVHVVG